MKARVTNVFAGSGLWQVLLLSAVVLLHAAGLTMAFVGYSEPAPDVTPPQLQGVLVQTVAVQDVLPEPIQVEQPPPEPPKPVKKPEPKPKPKPQVKATPTVKENVAAFQVAEQETAQEQPEEQQVQTEPETPPKTAKPAAAPVRMPDAHAAHLQNPAPVYPVLSRKLKEQGTVVLKLLVLANGRVGEVSIEQSSGYPRLDESALQAVRRWNYTPALQDGIAIDYWHLQPVLFSLN